MTAAPRCWWTWRSGRTTTRARSWRRARPPWRCLRGGSDMAIGKLFHIIHMTGDLPALESWYDDVFSVRRGFLDHHYMEGEKRDASLVVLGDCVIEPLAPAFRVQGWDVMPLGRFYQRFGSHWHSIAWYTDDAGEIWQRCTDNGIRVFVEGGVRTTSRPSPTAAIMTHPKDTIAQLEFMNPNGTLMESMIRGSSRTGTPAGGKATTRSAWSAWPTPPCSPGTWTGLLASTPMCWAGC